MDCDRLLWFSHISAFATPLNIRTCPSFISPSVLDRDNLRYPCTFTYPPASSILLRHFDPWRRYHYFGPKHPPAHSRTHLPPAFFLDISTYEEDTITLGRNILNKLLNDASSCPRSIGTHFAGLWSLKLALTLQAHRLACVTYEMIITCTLAAVLAVQRTMYLTHIHGSSAPCTVHQITPCNTAMQMTSVSDWLW